MANHTFIPKISREEMDDVRSQISSLSDSLANFSMQNFPWSANSNVRINIPSGYRGLMVIISPNSSSGSANAFFIVSCNTSGTIITHEVYNSGGITLTKATNVLTIANSHSVGAQARFLSFTESVPTEVS